MIAQSIPRKSTEYRRPWITPYQLSAIFSEERYSVIEATTKAGKTIGCLIWLFEQAAACTVHGRSYWWVAPVFSQSEVAYRRMKFGIPRGLFRSNDSALNLMLANGAMIWFKSADRPDNLFGDDVFAVVIDEASRVREESWYAIRSTITATEAPARIIGNVQGRGNWFYRMARRAERGALPDTHYSKITWRDAVAAGILNEAEIDDARSLPEAVFRELYEAEPAEASGRVYRDFSATSNVSAEVHDLGGQVLVGMDFNVNPMAAVLGSRAADELHVWGEVVLRNSNTQEMAAELRARFAGREVLVCPDPSGNSRKSSALAGETDFTILRAAGFQVSARTGQLAVADKINNVNSLSCSADGKRRLFVHPDCDHLLDALEGLTYKKDTSQPDKDLGLDHATDALAYLVDREFPIISHRGGAVSTLEWIGV